MRVLIPCAHEGIVHAKCMLDWADRITRGHADPRPCVVCQLAWPEGIPPPHSAELVGGLLMFEQRGRWAAVRSALQFAVLLQRGDLGTESISYVTTIQRITEN